jgi:hypothetical protein
VPFYGGVIGVASWVEPLILTVTSSKPLNQSRTDKLWPRFSSVGGDGNRGTPLPIVRGEYQVRLWLAGLSECLERTWNGASISCASAPSEKVCAGDQQGGKAVIFRACRAPAPNSG